MENLTTCLDQDSWKSIQPLGMNIYFTNEEILSGGITRKVSLELIHPNVPKKATLEIHLPIFNQNVINWRNSKKALLFKGDVLIDSDFDIDMGEKDASERMDLHITSPYIIANRSLESELANGLRNWFYDSEPEVNQDLVQLYIDKWFSSGKEWRVLKYSKVAQEDQNNGIILDLSTNETGHSVRMMSKVFNSNLWDIIDLNSTSISDKVNESFRFIEGCSYTAKKIAPPIKQGISCKILQKHAIGLGMNPRRAYLLRNTFEQVVDLVVPEYPKVSPYSSTEANVLHGLNLLTAIMHYKHYTHEDSIVISQSAADKFTACRTVTQLIESNLPISVLVKDNQEVDTLTVVAIDGENPVLASKLYFPGKVEEVSVTKGNRFGVNTNRVWLKYVSYYPLLTGDKLSNRHAGKGVVTIIPDKDMPSTTTGRIIDICIGPETITNRKAMSILWEMMLCKKADENGGHIKVDILDPDSLEAQWPTDDNHNFKLLAQSFGKKESLFLSSKKELPNKVFISDLFWMRIDKFAKEILSSVYQYRAKNNFGSLIDDAKTSGQRCNPAKLLALSAKKLDHFVLDIIKDNMSGRRFFTDLLTAAKNTTFIKDDN